MFSVWVFAKQETYETKSMLSSFKQSPQEPCSRSHETATAF